MKTERYVYIAAGPGEHVYLGCYYDSGSRRRLTGEWIKFADLTPRKCIGYCSERGYKYVGLQHG